MDDYHYIEKVLRGETMAYAFLVNKHKDMVFTLAFKITRNREDAEEIAQDTFVKAFRSLEKFKRKSKFSTWLFRIAYNTAISKTREKKTETIPLDDTFAENYSEDDIIENVERLSETDKTRLINQILEKLPEKENLLITLFYLEECSIEEISQIIGMSKTNVKVSLHRIRKKLFAELNKMITIEPNARI